MQKSSNQKLTPEFLSKYTYWDKEKVWYNNLAENLDAIRNGRDVMELKGSCAGPVIIVGAGPSVEKFNHLDMLKDVKCHVIATDRQLIPLLERNIIPEYVISVDADPVVAKFYDSKLVKENADKIKAIFATQIHNSVVKLCPFERYWFVTLIDDPFGTEKSISRAIHWMTNGKSMAEPFGNAGAFGWAFSDSIGHATVILVGIDFSYGPDMQPMQTMFWNGFMKKRGGNTKDVLKLDYRWETNPFGHRVLTDAIFDSYREVMSKGILGADSKVIQCSPYSVLHGAKIQTLDLAEALQKFTLQV